MGGNLTPPAWRPAKTHLEAPAPLSQHQREGSSSKHQLHVSRPEILPCPDRRLGFLRSALKYYNILCPRPELFNRTLLIQQHLPLSAHDFTRHTMAVSLQARPECQGQSGLARPEQFLGIGAWVPRREASITHRPRQLSIDSNKPPTFVFLKEYTSLIMCNGMDRLSA